MSFHSLHFQVRSVWLWLWRVVVRTSWSVGKPGQRGLWVMDMDGLQVGHCAAVPLPLAVLAVWWSGPLEGSVKSTSFHWWSESETATEHRDSDALVGLKSFLLPGFSRSEPEMSTYWWYWGKKIRRFPKSLGFSNWRDLKIVPNSMAIHQIYDPHADSIVKDTKSWFWDKF